MEITIKRKGKVREAKWYEKLFVYLIVPLVLIGAFVLILFTLVGVIALLFGMVILLIILLPIIIILNIIINKK